MKNYCDDNHIFAFVDLSLFKESVILKTLYWFGDKFFIEIVKSDDKQTANVCLTLKEDRGDTEIDLYLQKFERDLIDYRLRDIIQLETSNVRDLLIAKAFSNGNFEDDPEGEISDPVGYSPLDI